MTLPWKKRKNRRASEREFLLDVKLRTSQSRAARMRIAGIGLSGDFHAGNRRVRPLRRGGHWLLDGLVYKNDAFAIQQIDVQTDGVLTGRGDSQLGHGRDRART